MTLLHLAIGLALAAQSKPPELKITGVAGWEGRAVPGSPTPVLVDIENRGDDKEAVLALAWGDGSVRLSGPPSFGSLPGRQGPRHYVPVQLPAASRKRFRLTVDGPDVDGLSVWAFLLAPKGEATLAQGELPARLVEPHRKLVAVVGRDRPAGLPFGDVEVVWTLPDRLPEQRQGYTGLEALVWLDGRASDVALPSQLEALRLWVAGGGRMVVARADGVGLASTPLEELLPVRLGSGREVTRLDALAAAGLSPPPAERTLVLDSRILRGKARVMAESVPLVVEGPFNAGRVTFVAFDPVKRPFIDWADAPKFWAWMLELRAEPLAPESIPVEPVRARVPAWDLIPLAARHPGVTAPALAGLFVLIGFYLAAVGPFDYFVLRRIGRLEWTWITFPAYVLLFTGLILIIGGAFVRKTDFHREIAVLDYYPDTGLARRCAAVGILASEPQRYVLPDALPVTTDHLSSDRGGRFTASDPSDLVVDHHPTRAVRNWSLHRGATGIALVDRVAREPCPLGFTIEEMDRSRVRAAVRNESGRRFSGAILATPTGCYRLDDFGRGDTDVRGVWAGAAADFIRRDSAPPLPAEEGEGVSEARLNGQARQAVFRLSLGRLQASPALDATRWIAAGGSVLFLEEDEAGPMLDLRPAAGRRSVFRMTRIFQGPTP